MMQGFLSAVSIPDARLGKRRANLHSLFQSSSLVEVTILLLTALAWFIVPAFAAASRIHTRCVILDGPVHNSGCGASNNTEPLPDQKKITGGHRGALSGE